MKKFLFLLSLLIVSQLNLFAQENEEQPSVGVSAALQSGQVDFLLPIWAGEKFVIAPAFGVASISDGYTDVIIGVVPRLFFHREKVSPFISARIGGILGIPKTGDSTFDLIAGLGGGAEYFFDSHLSVGIETQLNVVQSDNASLRFANPGGTNINTATAIFATIYF